MVQAELPVVFMFSGQGSQYPGMGRALFGSDPVFRETLFRADRLLRTRGGPDLIGALMSEGDAWLGDLAISHPAIFAVEWGLYRALTARGVQPDMLLGSSLGEYAALAAAGCASFEDMLVLVHEQALGVSRSVAPGGMLAVVGPTEWLQRRPGLLEGVAVAAWNFDRHVVLAGASAALERCRLALEADGASCSLLPVGHAFHTSAVDPAREGFAARCAALSFAAPGLPVFSCATAGLIDGPDREHLWRIVREPVRFADTVHALERSGPRRYIDLGPSGTLATFLRYLLGAQANGRISTLMSPSGAVFSQALASLPRLSA